MMPKPDPTADSDLVPDSVIPHEHLPPLKYRELPEPVAWRKMLGPSIILAGLSLGSGEYILWPYITYKSGFVFFWACLLGVVTQFFINMEIERWTLATGESAITGFCRLSRHWAWIMLALNIIPWAWPGWATGAANLASWLMFDPTITELPGGGWQIETHYATAIAIGGLLLVGVVLTSGPVVYNTVEKIQTVLVAMILFLVVVIAGATIRVDAVVAMLGGALSIGQMPDLPKTGLSVMELLGALAFAGAGGTMNLGQSNLIKDKGYAMGRYIGRITSPLTGNEEAIPSTGFHFPHTAENMSRWRAWWRAANLEHFFSFLCTCVVCLVLMALIAYSLYYDSNGQLKPETAKFGKDMAFVWGQASVLRELSPFGLPLGTLLKFCFLLMGVAILFTTELGVLDVAARISTDIVKVNWLRENDRWPASRLYFLFLWGEILLGISILLSPTVLGLKELKEPLFLLKTSAAMNGGVMFVYSIILLYLNSKILSRSLSISPLRFVMLIWSSALFGYFTIQAVRLSVWPYLLGLLS